MNATPPRPKDHLATISSVLGIFSLLASFACCCIPLNWFFTAPLSAAAIGVGALALRRIEEGAASSSVRRHAFVGIATGALGLVTVAVFATLYLSGMMADPSFEQTLSP